MNRFQPIRPLAWLLGWATVIMLPATSDAQPEGVARPGTLYLRNGDFISGRVATSDAGDLIRWRSSLFQEPMRFDLRGVERIVYAAPRREESSADRPQTRNPLAAGFLRLLNQLPQTPTQPVAQGARIELTGGDVLFGKVAALDGQFLEVESDRHGSVRIRRGALVEVDGVSANASLLFDGSGNLAAWNVLNTNDFSADDWGVDGRDLVTTKIGANLFYQPSEEGRFVYELKLAGSGQPEFQLVFGLGGSLNDVKNGFSLETWGDDLVIHRQADGSLRHTVLTRPRWERGGWSLALEVYCDPDARRLVVFSQGQRLGELQTTNQSPLVGRGLLIRNRGSELKLSQARVRKWLGPMQGESQATGQDLVILTDGRWVGGELRAIDREQDRLVLGTPNGERVLPVHQVDRVRLQPPASTLDSTSQPPPVHVTYLDGGLIQGRYLRADPQGMWLATRFAEAPVLAGWSNLLEVRFPTSGEIPQVVAGKHGLVEHAGCRLHGRVLNGTGPADLLWEPVFSRDAAAFLATRTTRVTFEPQQDSVTPHRLTSELTLVNGDVIPCEIEAIDDQSVIARFAAGETARIPRDHLKAIRDDLPENRLYEGFAAGDRWYANRENKHLFRLRDGALELFGDILLARELNLSDRFRISFDVRFGKNVSLLFGVGGDNVRNALDRPENRSITEEKMKEAARQKPDNLIEVVLSRNGRVVTANGTSRVAGILGLMFRANVFGVQEGRHSALPLGENGSLHVELLVDRPARQYVVLGNGREMYRWRDPTSLEGQFLHLGVVSGENQRRQPSAGGDNEPAVALLNFRVDRWPGFMPEDHRDRFLTRRMGASEKSVTHALRAVNGDSLRGRLVALQKDQIIFQSRLETLTLPRDSVVEIISLQPLVTSPEGPSPPSTPVRVWLWRGGAVTLQSLRASQSYILGESPLAGEVSVPWSAVAMLEFGGDPNPDPPYASWVVRDPPPLPSFDEDAAGRVTSVWLDKPAPDFNLPILAGDRLALGDLRGRPVLLDFWATWCGPCIASMPAMIELSEEFAGQVEFIAINQQEDPEEVRDFLTARLWQLRVGLDQDGSLSRLFEVNAIPCTMILDAEGIVRHVHVGATPNLKAELRQVLQGLLKPPVP